MRLHLKGCRESGGVTKVRKPNCGQWLKRQKRFYGTRVQRWPNRKSYLTARRSRLWNSIKHLTRDVGWMKLHLEGLRQSGCVTKVGKLYGEWLKRQNPGPGTCMQRWSNRTSFGHIRRILLWNS